ncbi:Pseudouridine-5'-phosphatase [Dermatophagoides pteronyssinus]|uniref:Pseudouridine-5'-phosphatase n=2 Tax=Dermatophagoides pteronyssinus TaxID=6956 RepID=A0ABQ8J7N1_DERPT|nr:pseudouridine-5'-phosphatase-like [Dermatophagoides pteronyssinus]KAH9418563.1 Pseudouridine-5'-phosphatase [Dermatophagoides pteronyssinus]
MSSSSSKPLQPQKIITHVIFDMDGLILDTETMYEKAINSVTQRYGRDYPFEVKMKIMGRINPEGAQIIINELQLPLTVDEYTQQVDEEYRKVFSDYVPLMPGAERLIRHLYQHGIPIAIATSSKQFAFDLKTKHHQELFKLFHHIVVASNDPEIVRGKPDPQTFLVCARRFEPPPPMEKMSNVLVFEDSVAGIQAANAAGMQSVWVPDPRLPKNSCEPSLLLNSLLDFRPEQFGLPAFVDQ